MKYETSIILGCHSILVSAYNDVHVHGNDFLSHSLGARGLDVQHQSTNRDRHVIKR